MSSSPESSSQNLQYLWRSLLAAESRGDRQQANELQNEIIQLELQRQPSQETKTS